MTNEEAVAALDAIQPGDNDSAHLRADEILVKYLMNHSPEVAAAYERLQERVDFWYS